MEVPGSSGTRRKKTAHILNKTPYNRVRFLTLIWLFRGDNKQAKLQQNIFALQRSVTFSVAWLKDIGDSEIVFCRYNLRIEFHFFMFIEM